MKTTQLLFLAAALFAAGCQTTPLTPSPATKGNVTVNFTNPDDFTDVRESFGGGTSQYYLNVLTEHVQNVATRQLPEGQKLTVTFTDIDLAGDFRPGRPDLNGVRIMKSIYMPRMTLNFQLTGADGKVVKEGERILSDMAYLRNISIIDRDQPLFYDKALLDSWIRNDFR